MNENSTEPTISENDLQKSVSELIALLETDGLVDVEKAEAGQETVEKSMVGTEGALTHHNQVPPLNPELVLEQEQLLPDGTEEEEDENSLLFHMIQNRSGITKESPEKPMNKSIDAEQELETKSADAGDEVSAEDEQFAKSLAEAFASHEAVAEAASSSDFAKSLVLGTIEGLSIAHDEFAKSLATLEATQNEKFAVLAKSLAAIAKAVDAIQKEISNVSNAPVRPMAKSVSSVQVLEKSFGGSNGSGEPLSKAKVMDALEKLVQGGKMDAFHLVKFETTGVLDPAILKDVQSELGL